MLHWHSWHAHVILSAAKNLSTIFEIHSFAKAQSG